MNAPIEIEFDEQGHFKGLTARAHSLAEFREQLAELRRLGAD